MCGVVYYGVLLEWLRIFGVIAWLPLVLSQAAFFGAFGAIAPVLWREDRPIRSAALLGAAWTALDWVRSFWPVGGFGWGGLGYTQHANGLTLPLASVTGVAGVTFVVVAVNGLLLGMLRTVTTGRADVPARRAAPGSLAASVALIAVMVFAPAAIPAPAAQGRSLDVAVVQANVPRALSSDVLLQSRTVTQSAAALHATLAGRPPDLAVWPENALDGDPTVERDLGRLVSDAVRSVGAPTLVGAIRDAPGGRIYNEALLYSRDGTITGRYTKVHLVPFGEYVPWRWLLGWTERYRRGNADLAPGTTVRDLRVDGTVVGTPICFENVFPNLVRRFADAGARVLVVTTNDSSYLRSPASREHVIFSQLRAVENRRWVVQAALSGESAFVDPTGRIVSRTGLFTRQVLRHRVSPIAARTIYTRLGDWVSWLCALVLAGALLVEALPERRRAGRRAARGAADPAPGMGEPHEPRSEPQPVPISGGAGAETASTSPRTLVVLPTYNERATIRAVIAGVLAVAEGIDVLVVDDGSPDGTGDLVAGLGSTEPRIRLVRRRGKLGLASAYLTGFRRALDEGYDVVIEMDADLSHRPEDLPALLEGTTRYDLTIGSRYIPGGGVSNWSRTRLLLSRAGNAYARAVLGLPVSDATSGYRAFRAPVLEKLLLEQVRADGYAFQVELAYLAWRMGYAVGEVPITFREREHGRSKLSRRIVAEALVQIARWGWRDRVRRRR